MFNKSWNNPLLHPEFADWLAFKVNDSSSEAFCKRCLMFNLSNMGEKVIVSYSTSENHRKLVEISY